MCIKDSINKTCLKNGKDLSNGLLKFNFETRPKKRIFRFLPKISAGHGWNRNFFFANFQILGPLGCQGWVVIPQNAKKKSKSLHPNTHCVLSHRRLPGPYPGHPAGCAWTCTAHSPAGCPDQLIQSRDCLQGFVISQSDEHVPPTHQPAVQTSWHSHVTACRHLLLANQMNRYCPVTSRLSRPADTVTCLPAGICN
jgi:hypothetical protein